VSSAGEKQATQQAGTHRMHEDVTSYWMPRFFKRGMTLVQKVQLNASSRNAFNCA
jgi:hypothetical protein